MLRSREPELMDLEPLTEEDMAGVLRELTVVNRRLGGISSSLATLERVMATLPDPVVVADIGAGGGDLPRELLRRARRRGRDVRVVAIDASLLACRVAARRSGEIRAGIATGGAARAEPDGTPAFVAADGFRLPLADDSVDIAHSAMMFHHFGDEDVAKLLAEMRRVSRAGVLVNDLHRHALALHGIALLTRAFSKSRYVRNDAPLSVRRGFTRAEISMILLGEIAILTTLALPIGAVIGYGFGELIMTGFSNEVYRLSFVVQPATIAWAWLAVIAATIVSALLVRRHLDRLDLVAVLKTPE